ncbi:hypothetical protein [Streptosporangium sp. CA-115845]|uniref:hypothetical protein n=1 Tax=Streptosporangium sp. CA-115845 TaxID=3240071 RepID=UPI003D8FD86F
MTDAPAPGEVAILIARYGRRWLISEAAGGGYYAVRRHGLSNVMCTTTLGEMARRLAAERERGNRP